jgi:hypothetical protein
MEGEGPFDSAWLKFGWAIVHADALNEEIAAHALSSEGRTPFKTARYYDPKRHCIVLPIYSIEPFPIRWGLRLGDVVHGYRSALDHVAWAVVKRGRAKLTEKQERNVLFPIAKRREDFNSSLALRLPGASRADIAAIRRYQPYQRGQRNLSKHVLSILASLSNDDKHRTVQPVWALPERATWAVGEQRDCILSRSTTRARRETLKVGTELVAIYVRKTGPNPEVEVYGEVAADVAINDQTWLRNWLDETTRFINQLLREFATPPEDLFERIGISQPDLPALRHPLI